MKKSRLARFLISGLFLLLFLIAASSAQAQGKVKVGGFEIDVKGKEPAIPQELQPLQEGRYMKWIVQFAGPIHEVEKKALTDLGAAIGDYLPDFAFIVTMDNQARNQVEKLPFINGVARYKPAYKISPGLKDESGGVRLDKEIVRLWLKVDDVKNVGQVLSKVQKEKGNILEVSGKVMKMEVAPSGITSLAKIEEVVWIEEVVDMEILNDTTAWIIQTNQNNETRIWDKGLRGEGQIVGIGDTGLDYDMPWFSDPAGTDIGAGHRKIIAYDTTYGDDYDVDDPGHGTHVAGTVGGDRQPVDGLGNATGMAPKSRFFIQDLAPAGAGRAVYPPSDLGQMFNAPYQAGARIHTNSWGGRRNDYDTMASTADKFLWDHKEFLALFANGNSGPTVNTVANPATAKNVISVGATLNGIGAENVTSFSSNGPTADGRIKPTVCAPGDGESEGAGVVSADSDGVKESNNSGTIALRGTSMATPAVAGAAALVRQYLTEGYYPTGAANPADAFSPSAALVKAMLINSAQDMSGIYTDGPIPSTGQGWGRVNLSSVLAFQGEGKSLVVIEEDETGLATGQLWTNELFSDSVSPLKITLVWTDYPGAPGAGKALVNDLDLTVRDPQGMVYHGNLFSNGQSILGEYVDRLNVEEQVLIPSPINGAYEIEVAAFNVPSGPQPFALVVTGASPSTYKGVIFLDRGSYNGDSPAMIKVFDRHLNLDDNSQDTTLVRASSSTDPEGEMVTLLETGPSTGIFEGMLDFRLGPAEVGNGFLEVADGDTITAPYADADDGTGNPAEVSASALIDRIPPSLSAVTVDSVGEINASITWQTDEAATSVLNYGKTAAAGTFKSDPRLMSLHEVFLQALEEGVEYFFEVLSTDEAGNLAREDNGGFLHSFTTVNAPPSLTVNSSVGTVTFADTTVINGTVGDPSGVSSVTVNGSPAAIQQGGSSGVLTYQTVVALSIGMNTITVVATDNAEARNARTGVISVERRPKPDLIMTAVSGPTEGFPRQKVDVWNVVANVAADAPSAFSVGIYLSTNPQITTSDLRVGSRLLSCLAASTMSGETRTVTLPSTLMVGSTYYWGVIADYANAQPETDEANNTLAGNLIRVVEVPQYTISASFTGSGTVVPAGDTVVAALTDQSYSFSAAAGYRIGSVIVDGVNIGTPNGHTFYNVSADHTLLVNFISDVFTITATAGAGGTISPAGAVIVPRGGSQTFTFTPDPGYQVNRVYVGGGYVENVTSYTISNVQYDTTISVTFKQVAYTVTATAGANGSIIPDGTRPYVQGTNATYYIVPNAGYHVADVLVDGVSVGAVTQYFFTSINASQTIEASFSANSTQTYTISASATGGGTVTPAGDIAVPNGSSQSFSFTPDAGQRIGSVVVDGVDQGIHTSWTFSNVTANHILVVNFVPDTFTITATAGSGGSISPAGVTTVPRGGSLTYAFTPASGYRVQDVLVNGTSVGAPDSYTFTNVQANQTISVTFVKLTFTVTASATAGGTIKPSGTQEYVAGSSPSYSITASSRYRLVDVLVDGVSVGAVRKYTFKAINASHTIHAIFSAK